jgi:hypothetical protein
MNTQLQQAMAAVKAEPNNADSWFLLSQAVPTDQERAKLLRKVLSLNPNYPEAREQLAQLTAPAPPVQVAVPETVAAVAEPMAQPAQTAEDGPAAPLPISTNPLDFLAQSEADTIPPWMAGDTAAMTSRAVAETRPAEAAPALPKEEIPSWLQEEPNQEWLDKEEDKSGRVVWKAAVDGSGQTEAAAEAAAKAAPAPAKAKTAAPGSFWTSNAFLVMLGIVAILIVIAMAAAWLGS